MQPMMMKPFMLVTLAVTTIELSPEIGELVLITGDAKNWIS